jgi:hypothetical protein
MASLIFTTGVWRPIPVSGSSGTVTVTNPSAVCVMYVYILQGGVVTNWMKLQFSESKQINFPIGSTAQAMACGNLTADVVVT